MRDDDTAVREAIRRNVGHPPTRDPLHPPLAADLRYSIPLTPTRTGATTPGAGTTPGTTTVADVLRLIFPGTSYALNSYLTSGNRDLIKTPAIGFPYQLRRITLAGNSLINEAFSIRLLVSNSPDTTAVADPDGDDLVSWTGDLIGAEDAGIHLPLSYGPVTIEPWMIVTRHPTYLTLKVHNLSGSARSTLAVFDIDELPAPIA